MHKLKELSEEYSKKKRKLTEKYEQNLKDLLSERGLLDVRVICKEDKVEGELRVVNTYFSYIPQIIFYPVTKKGTISLKAHKYLTAYAEKDPLDNFEPKE